MLNLLDELDLAKNTIVIFTSDNGTTHLKDEVDYDFFSSVGELRGLKGSLYEGGIRVPMIVRWPGRIASGTQTGRVVGFEDFLPTLAALTGVAGSAVPESDGIDFSPTLLGKKQPPRPFLYREFSGYGGQQSLRFGKWKAVRQNMKKGNLEVELYNLASDPGEQRNVAAELPGLVRRATNLFISEHRPSERFPLSPSLP